VYLREMGAVPLFTREGELDLARRWECYLFIPPVLGATQSHNAR